MAAKSQPEQQEYPNGQHHGRLTITLRQTLSLTGNLLTLKLLHYLAILLDLVPKPSTTNPYQPTPLRRHTFINNAIECRERRIVELFMTIIQMSLFETIFLHAEDGISPERISAAVAAFFSRTPSASDMGSAMLRPGATATPAYVRAPSPLRASVGQISSVASENRAGGSGSSGAPVPNFLNTRYSVQKPLISDSVYSSLFQSVSDTACVPGSSTLGVPMRKTPSGPSPDNNNNVNHNSGGGSGAGKEEAVVDSPAASLRPIYSIVCPVWSSDSGQSQSQSQSPSQGLEMTESGRSLSTGSYPGRFPVSDGVEFSSLATADGAVKGRAATSVRPLSDFGTV